VKNRPCCNVSETQIKYQIFRININFCLPFALAFALAKGKHQGLKKKKIIKILGIQHKKAERQNLRLIHS